MKLLDVHCHLDEFFYKEDIDEVIDRCRQNNVSAVAAGVNPGTNRNVLMLKKKYPDVVHASLGIYPPDALKKETEGSENKLNLDYDIDREIEFIEKNKDNIVAVGEVGMDFKDGTDFEMQEKTFRKMIELAMRIKKPIIIHSRKAESKVIDILEEYNYSKVIMHCFGGKHSQVRRIRENNWYFSIPTSIVRDEHFQKIVKETQLRQLLLETDSPFLSPFKDRKNEPSFITETVKKISELKRLPEIDVSTMINRNCEILFFDA
ncbi:TPA: TatD family hydrolase [Candidatus Woesearchaeota archaeon]|nr:TatD family hydrolase [Candidatus Woesearchaeota archaeon]HIH41290.1 TatD family hydrolase [Candidatus Woesearchaeota archaeon]